jgi:lysophospholipase
MSWKVYRFMPYSPQRTRAYPAGTSPVNWNAADGWPVRMLRCDPDPHRNGKVSQGSIFLMGGRGDFIEKYLETIHDFRDAGFGVCAMDWRGQGGSGRLSPDQNIGHVDDFDVWLDDLRHFWNRFTAEMPGPHYLIGHSMGGHLVLRALAAMEGEAKISPKAAVLVAPMMGYRGGIPLAMGQQIAALMCKIGDPMRAAWKVSEKPGSPVRDRMRLLTHDALRYADETYWHQQNPALPLGPASWGWVYAGYRSMRLLLNPDRLARIQTPVLMLVATADGLVNPKMAIRAAGHIPNAKLTTYGAEAAHELLRELDAVRNDAMHRIIEFLESNGQVS